MQRIDLSMELTEGEVLRIKAREKEMGLKEGQIFLFALVTGFESLGLDIGESNPLNLMADDL